jgi:hypothetical protein
MVVPVQAFGLEQALVDTLQEAINSEAAQLPGYTTTTSSVLQTILSVEQLKQMTGCSDPKCVVDIGNAVNADRILACNAGLQGESVQLTCRLIGVREGAVLADKDRKVIKRADVLADSARALVGILLTGQARDRRGSILLKISQPGARVLVDGKLVGESPINEPLRLDEGARELVIDKGGYSVWRTRLDVQAGTFTEVNADLNVKARAFILAPFGVAALLGGVATGGVAVALGILAGAVTDCLYHGSAGGHYVAPALGVVSSDAASRQGEFGGDVCRGQFQTPDGKKQQVGPAIVSSDRPSYMDRPIDNFTHDERWNQILFIGNVLANVAFGSAAVLLVVGLVAGVALVSTDLIIRLVRREE